MCSLTSQTNDFAHPLPNTTHRKAPDEIQMATSQPCLRMACVIRHITVPLVLQETGTREFHPRKRKAASDHHQGTWSRKLKVAIYVV